METELASFRDQFPNFNWTYYYDNYTDFPVNGLLRNQEACENHYIEYGQREGRNYQIPIYIIAYNNLFHVKNMVNQLEIYTTNIHIIDNCSTYQPLLDYYATEYKYDLMKMDRNYGHLVIYRPVWVQIPKIFGMTDPDLQLNPDLPLIYGNYVMKN